jgi:hypothetical protein
LLLNAHAPSLLCNVPANPGCACGHRKSLKEKTHKVKARLKPFRQPFPRHGLDVTVKPSP